MELWELCIVLSRCKPALLYWMWSPDGKRGTAPAVFVSLPLRGPTVTDHLFHHLPRAKTIFKGNKFGERQSTSAEAKRAVLAKFQQRPSPDDPEVQARAAERKAIAEAREARLAERRVEREAEAARQAAEREAAAAAEAIRRREEEVQAAEAARAEALHKLEQKAARDARYAARKARR